MDKIVETILRKYVKQNVLVWPRRKTMLVKHLLSSSKKMLVKRNFVMWPNFQTMLDFHVFKCLTNNAWSFGQGRIMGFNSSENFDGSLLFDLLNFQILHYGLCDAVVSTLDSQPKCCGFEPRSFHLCCRDNNLGQVVNTKCASLHPGV